MKIFPTNELNFRLINDEVESLNLLNWNTEKSTNLTSQFTNKPFCGIVNGDGFKLVSSIIGIGAFCVMIGVIQSGKGLVKVEINKAFRILLSFIAMLPLISVIIIAILGAGKFSPLLIVVWLISILIIRALIELGFRLLSTHSLNQLRIFLPLEWEA